MRTHPDAENVGSDEWALFVGLWALRLGPCALEEESDESEPDSDALQYEDVAESLQAGLENGTCPQAEEQKIEGPEEKEDSGRAACPCVVKVGEEDGGSEGDGFEEIVLVDRHGTLLDGDEGGIGDANARRSSN
mgnify:CR=1 FL=1